MNKSILFVLAFAFFISCNTTETKEEATEANKKISVIFDTDANNELDDQHAMAYLFSNMDYFDIKAITVNATRNGGDIQGHFDEAERIMQLFNVRQEVPLIIGANKSYDEIKDSISNATFDGYEAVDFIINEAKKQSENKLVVIAVGKLTNLALALQKDPSIADKIRLVWLGANYPEPGEYNLVNDIPSMNYVLETNVDFEMVTVRYGKPSGTDAVKATKAEIDAKMPGLGPKISTPIIGRHGGEFDNFGDYAVNLFTHIDYLGDPPARALFDMAAVAIIKNPNWAEAIEIPCPIMTDEIWIEQPENKRKIIVWENFHKEEIMADFYEVLGGSK
ncbi:Inosine-uridine preferring nucleoside hydrolase [Spirosomataceae bacterium TFI 002]|nr:Inosine-uridine preferring nucleoside hydrolase [Spirosomataceae bacterium TFI 002]